MITHTHSISLFLNICNLSIRTGCISYSPAFTPFPSICQREGILILKEHLYNKSDLCNSFSKERE